MSEGYRNASYAVEKTLVKVFVFGLAIGAAFTGLGIWVYILVRH